MRFKQWLLEFGGAATTGMHGGFYDMPDKLNTDMPFGVRSKYATKDGRGDWQEDPDALKIDPDKLFGMKSPEDKKATIERKAKRINRMGVPLRMDRPDIPR